MWDRIMEKLSQAVSRRTLLGRAASACAAVAAAICGFAVRSSGSGPCGSLHHYYCCCVCSSNLCGGEYAQCSGRWCWMCPYKHLDQCELVACIECYIPPKSSTCFNNPDTCLGGTLCNCTDVYCSDFDLTGLPCPGGTNVGRG